MMKRYLPFLLFLISCYFYPQEADTALVRLEKELKLASTRSDSINAMLMLGEIQYDRDFSITEQIIDKALELIGLKNDSISQQQLAKAYVVKGVVHRREADYPKALEYYLKAQKIYKSQNDSLHISDVYHNMGMVYRYQKAHDKSIDLYKKAITIKTQLKDTHGIAAGYNMMGVSYRQTKRIDSALICYDKAKGLFNAISSVDDVQRVNNNMVAVYRDKGNYDEALRLASENIRYAKRLKKKFSLCTAYYNVSTIYKRKKEFNKGVKYADSSLMIAQAEGFRERIAKAYLRKSFLNHLQGNYKDAYFDYRTFNRHSDSIFNIENIKKIQALELSHKFNQEKLADSLVFAQEKREVALLAETEASKKWLYLGLLLIALIAALIIGFLVRRNYQNKARILTEKLEKEKVQKELLETKVKANEEETKRLIADNSMRLEFKQELLDRLKNEIAPEASNTVKEAINSLTSELQVQIKTEGKLSGLQSKIEEVNKGFDTKLRDLYPSLTKTEREMCALLRLNLSIKEIMIARNASLDSVKSTRYRIRKKLGLSSGEELEKFIQNIS
ncbi:tetratricopeptide repeat protein [Aquimarina algiphila]|uniref:Tetratricopeptide repeat protein n=2 Tax=Aquimarina algiphila TaxID=2047982 RepID=A0A554VIP1_9FLAO|nr:tetratricopeptide repeat protein [Aquimarina algiphila]TSE07675.1 tetratricopeptide repeat protein [Aquimarina algiphila]